MQRMGSLNRRSLFAMIGAAAGASVMYDAMTSMGFAAASKYTGPIKLQGDPKGASVVILGAGLAGMTAAYELRRAGYQVQESASSVEMNTSSGQGMFSKYW